MKSSLSLPVSIMLVSIPFGVAAQTAAASMSYLLWSFQNRKSTSTTLSPIQSLVIALPFILSTWTVITTYLNTNRTNAVDFGYIAGFLSCSLLPWIALRKPLRLNSIEQISSLGKAFWATVAVSQFILGWSLQNLTDGIHHRPMGFYSHPLTLAYGILLLWPWVVHQVFDKPRNKNYWISFCSVAIILILTVSRACLGLAALVLLYNIWKKLSGKVRQIATLTTLAAIVLTLATPNPVSSRFHEIWSADNPNRFSSYPDDRIAFWYAHLHMIQERPVLGHGSHLNLAYRSPYYDKIGLNDFIKKYEAHNQYLQIWADAGIIGLAIFLLWLLMLWRLSDSWSEKIKSPYRQALVCFMLSNLVQNAYYDSEVRHILTVMICITLLFAYKDKKMKA